jgi:3-oxoacyl-[acyl-carrier-protein] synthase-3
MKIGFALGKRLFDAQSTLVDLYGSETAMAVLSKTGPSFLCQASPAENSLTLSVESINRLIQDHEIDLKLIKNLISVTESPLLQFPGNAPLIASTFDFSRTLSVFDLNAGCTGFVDAIKIAMGLEGISLIICSETYSKHIRKFNRTTSCLFADGACAILLDPTEWQVIRSYSIFRPSTFNSISVSSGGDELFMDGKEVYNFVLSDVLPTINQIIAENPSIERAYLHQASKLVTDTLTTKLNKTNVKLPTFIERSGNFVSATLPLLMAEDMAVTPINSGEIFLIAGFGVGLSFSACVLKKNE